MINLLEESVRAAVKDTLTQELRMEWKDSVFREHPKYYGDVEFKSDNIIGDNGIVVSKKHLAFRYENKIGILSTDFESDIAEKLASGRKAEYGSKVYTTTNIDTIDTIKSNINALHFTPYNDDHLLCGDSDGTLSIFNITNKDTVLSVNDVSPSINSIAHHPSSSDILAIGGKGTVSIIDLVKNGQCLVSTKLADDTDDIINMTFSENSNYLRCITRNKLLFTYDPRCDTEITNCVTLRYSPVNIVNLYGEHEIGVCGLTSYLEPVVYAYDIAGNQLNDNIHEKYLFKQNYGHKQCTPMMKYDRFTKILYVSFRSCADLIALNTMNNYEKEALYHAVDDTFMAFNLLPKHAVRKREINRVIKFSKHRIQQIVHTRGGKLIYDKISSNPKASLVSASDYFTQEQNVSYPDDDIAICVPMEFVEEKKRSVSLYTHITGREPTSADDHYFDLKLSGTVHCNLGQNIRSNCKYALFPSPTYGGGALGVIKLASLGRKKQSQLSAHSEKITTFDVCRIKGNEDLVITGSPDCKAIVSQIKENPQDTICGIDKVYTVQCLGKVTFVAFHPRINGLCVIASNKDHGNECYIQLYDYKEGKVIKDIVIDDCKNVMDVQFEPIIGFIAAISASDGMIRLMDIHSTSILKTFKCDTFMRDTKLFWCSLNGKRTPKYMNHLICLGFGTSSVRKCSVYDVRDVVSGYYASKCSINIENGVDDDEVKQDDDSEEKKEEIVPIASASFGVSNAIPVGHFDSNDNLFYVASIGDRKIRTFELTKKGFHEMHASYHSTQDIQGIDFVTKQLVDVNNIEMAHCLKLTKDGVLCPVSFFVPRKRTEFFQDDLYSKVLDIKNKAFAMSDVLNDEDRLNVSIYYISLQPKDMELLSNAPMEALTDLQKRKQVQNKAMENEKLKQQPKSTEQAFDQFSRMVADAPTANRWDAQNIGTEVDDDEWDD